MCFSCLVFHHPFFGVRSFEPYPCIGNGNSWLGTWTCRLGGSQQTSFVQTIPLEIQCRQHIKLCGTGTYPYTGWRFQTPASAASRLLRYVNNWWWLVTMIDYECHWPGPRSSQFFLAQFWEKNIDCEPGFEGFGSNNVGQCVLLTWIAFQIRYMQNQYVQYRNIIYIWYIYTYNKY
jgi:hypothetical protein